MEQRLTLPSQTLQQLDSLFMVTRQLQKLEIGAVLL